MSGTALSPGTVRDTAINATWALDRKLHCRSFNSSELLECFRKQLKDEILDVAVSFSTLTLSNLKGFATPFIKKTFFTYESEP